MHSPLGSLALLSLAVALPGCGPARPAGEVRFRLTVKGPCEAVIQLNGFSSKEYLSVAQRGERLKIEGSCEICDCDGCPSCAVCGRALAQTRRLAPGETHEYDWDGRLWSYVENGCRPPDSLPCERASSAAAGSFAVAVSYGHAAETDTELGANDSFVVGPLLTAERSFATPAMGPVEVELDTTPFQVRDGGTCRDGG